MSNSLAVIDTPRGGFLSEIAGRYGMDGDRFKKTLMGTVVPRGCTEDQFFAFLVVAREHSLNPLTKEIYAMPTQNGIQSIVSIDGWMKLMNDHPAFDGLTFVDHRDGDKLVSITAQVHRKDRRHPVEVTEYLSECARNTAPWKQWPHRMLRHKAAIQAARYAFGFSGFVDPDEYDRFGTTPHDPIDVTPASSPLQASPAEGSVTDSPSESSAPIHDESEDPAPKMNKAKAREPFKEMQEEIRTSKNEDDLKNWGAANSADIATLPDDWQQEIRKQYREKLADHREAAKAAAEAPTEEENDAPF